MKSGIYIREEGPMLEIEGMTTSDTKRYCALYRQVTYDEDFAKKYQNHLAIRRRVCRDCCPRIDYLHTGGDFSFFLGSIMLQSSPVVQHLVVLGHARDMLFFEVPFMNRGACRWCEFLHKLPLLQNLQTLAIVSHDRWRCQKDPRPRCRFVLDCDNIWVEVIEEQIKVVATKDVPWKDENEDGEMQLSVIEGWLERF